jgi:CheY-like chemotaxis protein
MRSLVEAEPDLCVVGEAGDAEATLAGAAAVRPDVLVLDLEMPRMHGYELIREVRFLPRFKALPLVVISSRSGSKHQDQARSLGATDYLTKPFTAQVLKVVLGKLLKNWNS